MFHLYNYKIFLTILIKKRINFSCSLWKGRSLYILLTWYTFLNTFFTTFIWFHSVEFFSLISFYWIFFLCNCFWLFVVFVFQMTLWDWEGLCQFDLGNFEMVINKEIKGYISFLDSAVLEDTVVITIQGKGKK